MSAITVAHASADLTPPNTRAARAVLRRHRAELAEAGRGVRKAKAMTITALRAMVDTLDVSTIAGVRHTASAVEADLATDECPVRADARVRMAQRQDRLFP